MLSKKWIITSIILFLIITLILLKNFTALDQYLSLSYIKTQHQSLVHYYSNHKLSFTASYFLIYIIVITLSIPIATLLTILAGSIFGLINGTLIVSFASSIGATCAFLIVRYGFRDYFQNKFATQLTTINAGIQKEGIFYLFTLHLIPIFPLFLINITMALTPIKTSTFYWVSQIAMLPITIVFVNAGKELAKINSTRSILSPTFIIALAILGLLPLFYKYYVRWIRQLTT